MRDAPEVPRSSSFRFPLLRFAWEFQEAKSSEQNHRIKQTTMTQTKTVGALSASKIKQRKTIELVDSIPTKHSSRNMG